MEYVSKEAVLSAIEDAIKRECDDEQFRWKEALGELKISVEEMEPSTCDEIIAAALAFREPMAPVLRNKQVYVCGMCGHKVNLKHSFCKWCGQRILKQKGDDANDSTDK